MMTFDEAHAIAKGFVGPNRGLVDESTREFACGWYFVAQGTAWLATRAFEDLEVGSGGILVDRSDGTVTEFGSGYPVEVNVQRYEAGYRHTAWTIVVEKVLDLQLATTFFNRLGLCFTESSFAAGDWFHVSRPYSLKQLKMLLQACPIELPVMLSPGLFDLIVAEATYKRFDPTPKRYVFDVATAHSSFRFFGKR